MNEDIRAILSRPASQKTGKPYNLLTVSIGNYKLRGFPTEIEFEYLSDKMGVPLDENAA